MRYAVIDILDAELQAEAGMTLCWYDVLVNLEEAERPVRMNELASRILASKSGLTRVIDRMEEAGLVERQRPPEDRRAIEVVMTPKGAEALQAARVVHRRGIQEHFAQHLDDRAFAALLDALRPVREHVRPLRPVGSAARRAARLPNEEEAVHISPPADETEVSGP
jgi:DNA-binding MarR family transcriptional regulator